LPDRAFKTITVTEQLHQQFKQRAKKENKKTATFVSEILEATLHIEDRLSNCAPLLNLISVGKGEVVVRDNKVDRIVGVRAKAADGGKVKFYCELDNTDHCPHTAPAPRG
jgi:hypothetical protein